MRQRFRLRFGAKVKIDDETELGFRLGTGATAELISNDQTFDDTFQFEDFNVTNAHLEVAPEATFGWARPYVHVWGGKFDIPLYNPPTPTGLVFDRDPALARDVAPSVAKWGRCELRKFSARRVSKVRNVP